MNGLFIAIEGNCKMSSMPTLNKDIFPATRFFLLPKFESDLSWLEFKCNINHFPFEVTERTKAA